jgi:hypothetical protein
VKWVTLKYVLTFEVLEVQNSLEELLKVVLLCTWFFPIQSVRFQILTVVNTTFCDMTPRDPLESYQCFRATCCLRLQGKRWKHLLLQKLLTFYHTTCRIPDNSNVYQYSPSMNLQPKHTYFLQKIHKTEFCHIQRCPRNTVHTRVSLSSNAVLLSHERE